MAVKESHEDEVPLSLYRDTFQWSVTKMLLCIMNNKKAMISSNKYILAHFQSIVSEL